MPEIPSSRGDDIHNMQYMDSAGLVLFMAGNQFMVMDDLLSRFREIHPDVKRIFYETLPPGLELRQILASGAVFQVLELGSIKSRHLCSVSNLLKQQGYSVEILPVEYEFQRGGNEMLAVKPL